MNHETELATRMLLRDRALDLRVAYEKARHGSDRWAELDHKFRVASAALARAASSDEGQAIFTKALADIEAIAAADQRDRESERRRPNPADEARLYEQRRQHRVAWAERISRNTATAIRALRERLNIADSRVASVTTEAEFREVLSDISDWMRAMGATLGVEASASVDRESEASKAA